MTYSILATGYKGMVVSLIRKGGYMQLKCFYHRLIESLLFIIIVTVKNYNILFEFRVCHS